MLSRVRHISLLRSSKSHSQSGFYKHFVPTGLAACAIALTFVAVTKLRASEPATNSEVGTDFEDQTQVQANTDYSKFQHTNPNHARLPCALCHRRDSNAAVPKIPGGNQHLPCAGCHVQQFAANDGPICSNCHTDAKSGALKSFPRLKSFNVRFDHARHAPLRGASCGSCHRPARGGVALTIPAGFNAHNACFRCHTPGAKSAERDISSCGTCHQPGRYSRTPQNAMAFRVGFSHAKHNETGCANCHQVRAGMPQRRQVRSPQPLHHHATSNGSCMTCHDGKRAFGGDDFSACKRCHTGTTWHFQNRRST